MDTLYQDLGGFECMADKQLRTFAELIDGNVKEVSRKLQEYLKMPETQRTIG